MGRKEGYPTSLSFLLSFLPTALCEEISAALSSPALACAALSEVRLRCGRIASLSLFRGGSLCNYPLKFIASPADIARTLSALTDGSLFAHEETLKEGFFSLTGGVRVGVTGNVYAKGGEILSLCEAQSVVLRLPAPTATAEALTAHFFASAGGILLFSPPGGGKTTALRALAAAVARTRRVAVVDTRGELFFDGEALLLDRLSGYPKALGAEIAVRTLSPELLILDEIGVTEAEALAALVSLGVRTVASVHAESAEALLHTPSLRPLLASGLFASLWDVRSARAVSL